MYRTLGGSGPRSGSAGEEGGEEEEARNGSVGLWCPCDTVDGL